MSLTPVLLGILHSNGDIENASGGFFSTSLSDPRNMCYFKNDSEQLLGTDQGVAKEGGELNFNSVNVSSVLDPKVVSISRKPDTGEYWALLSYGLVVRVNLDGSLDFSATCPFSPGCNGYERFQSLSAGKSDNLYLLDHDGQLFNAKNLNTPEQVYSARVQQVSYY